MPPTEERAAAWERGDWDATWYCTKCYMRYYKLKDYLEENGIGTALHYPTILPLLECYKNLNHSESDFPIGFNNSKKILSLPMFPELSNDEIEYVCNKIKEFYI